MKKYFLFTSLFLILVIGNSCIGGLTGGNSVNIIQTVSPNNLSSIYEIVPLPDTSNLGPGEKITNVEGNANLERISDTVIKISNKNIGYAAIGFPDASSTPTFVSFNFIFDSDRYDTTLLFIFNGGYLQYFPRNNNFYVFDSKHNLLITDHVLGSVYPADVPSSIPYYNAMSMNKLTLFQDGKKVYFFLNDNYFATATVPSLKNDNPGIALYVSNSSHLIESTITGYFAATGKLAVDYMKSLANKIAQNKFDYNDLFEIKISGGINPKKQRITRGGNEVTEGQATFQTVDYTAIIKPRPNAEIQYPARVTVDYTLITVEQRVGDFLIHGKQKEKHTLRQVVEKDYVLNNSSQDITYSGSFEYMESYKISDMSRDVGVFLLDDPNLSVDVVEVFH